MPQAEGGGSSISRKKVKKIGYRSAVTGEKTGRVTAARSKAIITAGTSSQKKTLAKGYAAGAAARAKTTGTANALARGRGKKVGLRKPARAMKKLVRSSGTTKGEVRGVMKSLKSGKMTKGQAIRELASDTNMPSRQKAAKAISPAQRRRAAKQIRALRSRSR